MSAEGPIAALKSSSIVKVFKKVFLVGCILGVGAVVGAVLISHQHATRETAGSRVTRETSGGRFRRAVDQTMNRTPTPNGALFTRWGRTVCPPSTSLVYRGAMASGAGNHVEGGSEYLCLAERPSYANLVTGGYGYLVGVEFTAPTESLFSKINVPSTLANQDAVCAVCRSNRSVQLMIPGRNTCFDGWNEEYRGYIMGGGGPGEKGRRNYVCVDEAPEVDKKGSRGVGTISAKLWPVESYCSNSALPCPNYIHGNEVTCVVCSQ